MIENLSLVNGACDGDVVVSRSSAMRQHGAQEFICVGLPCHICTTPPWMASMTSIQIPLTVIWDCGKYNF